MEQPTDTCSYLPNESQSLTYRVSVDLPSAEYARLLSRGWRRQGVYFFRPNCPQCTKCRSLRVPVQDFRPTKSQRRTVRRNEDVEVRVTTPKIDQQHIDLFNRYHQDMRERRGWSYHESNAESYAESFLGGRWTFDREMSFWRDEQLIGVSLIDVLDNVASSIYFYHDPDWRSLSPGTFSMMCELGYMRTLGLEYHYLGYWITECQSMAYKARFVPHELLEEYVADTVEPMWTRVKH